MALHSFSFNKAYENLRGNIFSRWFKEGSLKSGSDKVKELAFKRLGQDLFIPSIDPTFQVEYTDKVFAIGSCFARGIEGALAGRGLKVESMASEFNDFELVNDKVTGLGFTNKYSTFAILNEVKWALNPSESFPKKSIVEIGQNQYVDLNTNPTLKYVGLQETLNRRDIITNVVAKLKDCRVIFLTLGLVEVWFDEVEKTFLNMAPTREMNERYPDRYTFHVTTFEENKNNLDELYSLLSLYGHPDFKVIVTVSPVPLMATFTSTDIVTANTYSKSMLRAVAEEWSSAHDNIDYFPSYEIVMNSKKSEVWSEDLRHVQGQAVQHIMRIFVSHYLPASKKEIKYQAARKRMPNFVKIIYSKIKNG